MLSEEDKNRIVQEEKYREEVRQQLKAPTKKSSKIMSFLNSNFASFLLSTVIVGGISVLYSNHQEALKKIEKDAIVQKERNLSKRQVKLELAHRLQTIANLSDTLVDYKSKDVYLAFHGSSIGNDPNIKARFFNFRSHYEKYASYNIFQLIDEVQQYDDEKDYSKLKEAAVAIQADIVDLGQEWFYTINGRKTLPKRIQIHKNKMNGVFYYRIDNVLKTLETKDSFSKRWYIGDRKSVQLLNDRIYETLNGDVSS